MIFYDHTTFSWWRVYRADGTVRLISPGERDTMLNKIKARKAAQRRNEGGGVA